MTALTPFEVAAFRRQARERLIAARRARSSAAVIASSAAIAARLETLLPSYPTKVVAFFWPLAGEIDLRPFVARLRTRGATLALPICGPKSQPLVFGRYDDGTPLSQSKFGLWEPQGAPLVVPTLLLVPTVGFDATCQRLGHGAGYYDRTLAGLPGATAIGVAYDDAELPTIHPLPHDVPLTAIVTETRTLMRA